MSETPEQGPDDIHQKDLLRQLRISGGRIKKLREQHLTSDDWYYDNSKPGRAAIYYRPSAIEKFHIVHAASRIIPLAVPIFCKAVYLRDCPNKKKIYARITLPTGDQLKAAVFVTPQIKRTMKKLKPFKVQLIQDEDGNRTFRHERLCP